VFRDSTLDAIRQRLAKAGLNQADTDRLLQTAKADHAVKGFVLRPPDDLVKGIAPDIRATLYIEMGRNTDNPEKARPFMFRGSTLDEWFDHSGVQKAIVEKIKPLVYRRESYIFFSDLQLVLPAIPSSQDRANLGRALHRTATYRVRVSLNEGGDPKKLVAYWGRSNRHDEIDALVTALATEPDGMSIVTLLPPFARQNLYEYPHPFQNDEGVKHDCFWASLNFFNDPPVEGISTNLVDRLQKDYQPLPTPTQLGDVVLLWEGNKIIHGCVYLAGDLVFTKNGMGRGQPFVIEKLDHIVSYYSRIFDNVKVGFCRRKGI
jgi:hypothetical protein